MAHSIITRHENCHYKCPHFGKCRFCTNLKYGKCKDNNSCREFDKRTYKRESFPAFVCAVSNICAICLNGYQRRAASKHRKAKEELKEVYLIYQEKLGQERGLFGIAKTYRAAELKIKQKFPDMKRNGNRRDSYLSDNFFLPWVFSIVNKPLLVEEDFSPEVEEV